MAIFVKHIQKNNRHFFIIYCKITKVFFDKGECKKLPFWINRNMWRIEIPTPTINRNMRCIEILLGKKRKILPQINRNMRCIEIGLTDKNGRKIFEINRNMRCIEILQLNPDLIPLSKINRNMRCIEIPFIIFLSPLTSLD